MGFIVAIDFDGTIAEHACFPKIGRAVPGAFEWMKKWQDAGASLILWTMRSDGRVNVGDVLQQAVDFCRENGIVFHGVNEHPGQRTWTGSPKAYAHVYVDDLAFGCPLRESIDMGARKIVDWEVVGPAILSEIESHVTHHRNLKNIAGQKWDRNHKALSTTSLPQVACG